MSRRIRVLAVFGTRPEAIKMAPLVLELKARPDEFECLVCVSAQHRQMLDQVLAAFRLAPDFDLDIMEDRQTLTTVTVKALQGLGKVMAEVRPDIVLVHGDTTTTMAGSLAAYYNQVRVGHVEAGLRTWNRYSPFPEEMNRQITGVIADLHFAPTELSRRNLLSENKDPDRIVVTGNTAIDALKTTVRPDYAHPELDWAAGSRLILVTAHRRENLGEPMRAIFRAILRTVEDHPDVRAIYPVHLNPVVRGLADEILKGHDRIHLVEPLDVLDFHNFLARAYLVLTDSGGIQEEAPSLGKPVLVLRDTTERPEGLEAGTLRLVGTDEETIYRNARELLTDPVAYAAMAQARNPYGDGQASRRIAEAIRAFFGSGEPGDTQAPPESGQAGRTHHRLESLERLDRIEQAYRRLLLENLALREAMERPGTVRISEDAHPLPGSFSEPDREMPPARRPLSLKGLPGKVIRVIRKRGFRGLLTLVFLRLTGRKR